jgi:hypothetical protein
LRLEKSFTAKWEDDDVQFQIKRLCCVVLTGSVWCLPLSWLDWELACD